MIENVFEEDLEVQLFEDFLNLYYKNKMEAAILEGKKSFEIDYSDLAKFNPELAEKILNNPTPTFNSLKSAIKKIDLVVEQPIILEPRIKNLPEDVNIRIRNIRSEHIGKFICIEGIVRRASEVRPEILEIEYRCQECGRKISVEQKEKTIKQPEVCECGKRGKFEEVDKKRFDARWIVLEETFEVASGEKLGEIRVYLKNDLTTPEMQRKTDPGNRLKITGIVKELKKFTKGKMRTDMDIYLEANHIENIEIEWEEVVISPEDEEKIKELAKNPDIYNILVSSIAPSIYGMDDIKKAIVFQLFGGERRIYPDKTKVRGDIHILLLGDPSTAKSQLLKLVSNIIPRGKYVSGHGTSAAGLTATVIKDEEFLGGWVLEAGAMVLANKGILAIDEFDKMSKEDQIAMHEALEQQTISIAKASIVATLPAQVSVLAGANPKFSRFDRFKSISEQIDIPQTLLSRFDLKFALFDIPDIEKDEKIADHIMKTRLNPASVEPIIKPEFLRKYIAYARKNIHPELTQEALERIKKFYIEMRSMYSSAKDAVPITLRQQEALIRLAEASAKIRLSDKVTIEDAERAIEIMNVSIRQLGYDVETQKFDVDKLEGGMPASQRNKITIVLDTIEELEKSLGKQIP
ncbi:MAG: minichromosome maintenance protein MCM, partial [Candidatus Aenigmatarchaeota archaeon]